MTQLTDKSTRPAAPADDAVAADAADIAPATGEVDVPLQIDVAALGEQLLGQWAYARKHARDLMTRPEFHRDPDLGKDAHRERVLGQLHKLVEAGSVHRAFPKSVGGDEDNGGNIASFEELVLGDPSMQIKSGVQWGLFAAAIQHLGTEKHHRTLLPPTLSLEVPGAFAMTETGHGSDVSAVGTTATYDPATDEWVINTPFRAAWKDYLGNAALHAKAAVVFAQLITRGVNHGVHAIYVPIDRPRR